MIEHVSDRKVWEEFIKELDYNTFLHSSGWVDFNAAQGLDTFRLIRYIDGRPHSAVFAFVLVARRGRFLFVPHGPQSVELTKQELAEWTNYLTKLAALNKCSFVRISPILHRNEKNEALFASLGYRRAPIHMHAELTTVVDITPSLEEILLGMRKTTRQMCRKGMRMIEDGTVEVEDPGSITSEMYKVYEETAERGGFVGFSKEYLQREVDSFNNEFDRCELRVIRHNGQILSWGLWILSGTRAFYHQGANILHRKIPASYLSHWLGIQLAKDYGARSYDFWGVSPQDEPQHPWANISLFKRGFGGADVALVPAQDHPVTLKYWFTWAIDSFRAKKRGF